MSKTELARLSPRDQKYVAQIEANLAEIKKMRKAIERDRKRGPLVTPRKISIVDEVKEILGIR